MLDLLFPERCAVCSDYLSVEERGVCRECESLLPGLTPPPCPDGMRRQAAGAYEAGLADAIRRLKFKGDRWRGRGLGMASRPAGEFDAIVPVPLHSQRFRERGYNQALLIARGVSATTGVPCRRGLLRRIRFDAPQASGDAEARSQIEGAFRSRAATGLRVLIVDDVTTTGHTLEACRSALRAAGASYVEGFALAFTESLGPLDGADAP